RELSVEVDRVEMVVLTGEVQSANGDLAALPPETVAGQEIELRELLTAEWCCDGGTVLVGAEGTALEIPAQVRAGEPTGWMAAKDKQPRLMQVAGIEPTRASEDGRRNLGQVSLQFGVDEAVACAEGPVLRNQLVDRDGDRTLAVAQVFLERGRRGKEGKWRGLEHANGAAHFRVQHLALERHVSAAPE